MVVVSGFLRGKMANDVKTLRCGALTPERAGYARSYTRVWRVTSAFLECEAAEAAREFAPPALLLRQADPRGAPPPGVQRGIKRECSSTCLTLRSLPIL